MGLITSTPVANRIAARWPADGLFASRWENMIGGWATDYAKKYGKAPGREIETLFLNAEVRNEDEASAIDKFLQSLSKEYDATKAEASEYIIDLAGGLFNRVKAKELFEEGLEDIKQGDLTAALKRLNEYRNVDLGPGAIDCPDTDPSFWESVFEEDDSLGLFSWSGERANAFFGNEFARDSFIAFQASEKRGKSFWLQDIVVRAVRSGNRVAYFVVGDMSRKQVGKRLARRITRTPKIAMDLVLPDEWPDGQELPNYIDVYREPITPVTAFHTLNKWTRGKNRLRFQSYPAGSITAAMLEALLKEWARDGWLADVVVIDYADILAVPLGTRDEQQGIFETWVHLRRMSQVLHCCVVTATQADAKSYDAELQSRKNFSRDKRKYGQVTAMYGLNQNPEEKKNGISRINCLARRDEDYDERQALQIAGNLSIGCPALISR